MHTTSASLLLRLRQPNETEAWARFVRLYSPMLYTWARHLGLQDADAVDLVQDVFTILVQKLPEFNYDDHKRFRGWLWTVTRNRWRRKYGRPALPLDRHKSLDELAGKDDDALEEAEFRRDMLKQLLPAQEKHFQPTTWRAFWEYVVEGKPASEIAASLGVTEKAIYMAKIRVLARLHRELAYLIED